MSVQATELEDVNVILSQRSYKSEKVFILKWHIHL